MLQVGAAIRATRRHFNGRGVWLRSNLWMRPAIQVTACLVTRLARTPAKVSLFAFSAFDTDYLLLREEQLHTAITVLRGTGHYVKESGAASY
jgi:ACT domain